MSNHGLVMRFEKLSRCSTIWEELFNQTPNSSPFISRDWFYALCKHLLKIDPEIMIFLENDRPVGIIPGVIENDTLRLIGDERVTDIDDIIYLPGYEHSILEELASLIRSKDLRVDLSPVENQSPLILYLPELMDDLITEEVDICPILCLPDSWEEYLNNLDGKSRHELRRKLRKVVDVNTKSIGPEQIEILFHLMIASDKNKKNFLKVEICEFFRAIARSFYKNNWLRFRATFLDSQPIGVVFSFQNKDRIYLYNTGFDPTFSHLSPGIVTIGLDIKTAIYEDFKYYDFLRGEEEYKLRFGAREHYTMRIRR